MGKAVGLLGSIQRWTRSQGLVSRHVSNQICSMSGLDLDPQAMLAVTI
jgi:hypothetical protein